MLESKRDAGLEEQRSSQRFENAGVGSKRGIGEWERGSGEWLVASDGMTQERGKRVAGCWKDRKGWEFGDVGDDSHERIARNR